MPHYGILREYTFEEGDVDELRGAAVYGVNDEKLGKIDDVIFDHSTGDIRYVVLNTGGLFSRKKVMVPAGRIEPYGNHDDKFYVDLDQERLEMLPEFDEKMLSALYDWSQYEKEYEKRWSEGAVLYNKDTTRIITPPTEEVAGARRVPLNAEERESLNRDFTPEKRGQQDDLLGVASGTGKTTLRPQKPSVGGREDVPREGTRPPVSESLREPRVYKVDEPEERRGAAGELGGAFKGRRWSSFQERLRLRRKKIVIDCPQCGSQEKVA
jgi:sporulation protein YlmC with PRC-barrel domain